VDCIQQAFDIEYYDRRTLKRSGSFYYQIDGC